MGSGWFHSSVDYISIYMFSRTFHQGLEKAPAVPRLIAQQTSEHESTPGTIGARHMADVLLACFRAVGTVASYGYV